MMVATMVVTITYLQPASASSKHVARRELKKFNKFFKTLSDNHIDILNYRALIDGAIEQIVDQCDPYSRYLHQAGEDQLSEMLDSESVEECYMVDGCGVVRLKLFSRNSAESILAHYNALECPDTLLLDLRGNQGGLVSQAIKTANLFLKKNQTILFREGRTIPRRTFRATEDGKLSDIKLIVLIDQLTASASEIVVGALKDHKRATVVGERSFGKGIILKQYEIDEQSSVLIAIAQYFTPSDKAIQSPYKGRKVDRSKGAIEPDIIFRGGKIIESEELKQINNEILPQ